MRQDAEVEAVRMEIKRLQIHGTVAAGALRGSDPSCRAQEVVRSLRYPRYLVVSAISLGVDLTSFLLILQINVGAVQASILGYVAGLLAHWLLSSRLVFADKIQPTVGVWSRQKLLFVISALIGLAITAAMIECGLRLGINPGLSKLAAIAVSFHVTYMLRRCLVFR